VFGALVRLTSATDFSDSRNLSTPEVLGAAHLTTPSQDWFAVGLHSEPLRAVLSPGWYALVFGGGLFGSEGGVGGYLTTEHQQLGNPRAFVAQETYRPIKFHPDFAPLMFLEANPRQRRFQSLPV
jgi:hypothetical protein